MQLIVIVWCQITDKIQLHLVVKFANVYKPKISIKKSYYNSNVTLISIMATKDTYNRHPNYRKISHLQTNTGEYLTILELGEIPKHPKGNTLYCDILWPL